MPRIIPSKLDTDVLASRVTTFESSLSSLITKFDAGHTEQDGAISTLSSPSQLKHGGFYSIGSCASDLGVGFSDWQVGDYHAMLVGFNGSAQSGCSFGNLVVFSPRFGTAFWVIQIWNGAWGSAKKYS